MSRMVTAIAGASSSSPKQSVLPSHCSSWKATGRSKRTATFGRNRRTSKSRPASRPISRTVSEARTAQDFSRQAVASAERAEEKEAAATYEADAALREALFGNEREARLRVASALRLSTGLDAQYRAALALAFEGDTSRSETLGDELGKLFPEDTSVQYNYLPTLHAQLAISRNDPAKAIETLQATAPYELSGAGGLYPVYVRGQAYLAAHQGSEAEAEFQKILNHRGIVLNSPIGALAHLQIGRAYALQGDTAKAKAAYQDFLTLWKDADPDIPIFIAAKAEYAKLK